MTAERSAFESYTGVKIPEWWPRGRQLLALVLSAREAAQGSLSATPDSLLATEPTFGLLHHLSERIYEQLTGGLICFAAKHAAASEVVSRVVIESSVNLRFILSGHRESLVLAWLRSYVDQDEAQISRWERALASIPGEIVAQAARLETRRQVLEARRRFLEQTEVEFRSQCTIDTTVRWPNVADRFERIGETLAYRTVYARLSSQTHVDAEDTINYVIVSAMDNEETLRRMSAETVAFSEYLLSFGSQFYFCALRDLCSAWDLEIPGELGEGMRLVGEQMVELAEAWRW
jgi:hypothetical protein